MRAAVETKDDILKAFIEKRNQLGQLGVRRVGLFGSFVRGEQRAASDVDVLVEFGPGQKTFDHFMQVVFFLEDTLQRRVEVVTPESLSPHIRPYILRETEYVPITA